MRVVKGGGGPWRVGNNEPGTAIRIRTARRYERRIF